MQQDHQVIANVDAISAPELVYPQAVYLHNGESYFVRKLDLEGRVAYVERHEMDYYTQAILESSVLITKEAGLSDAVPTARLGEKRKRIRLRGEPPSATEQLRGCAFASRCPIVKDKCRDSTPALERKSTGREVACFFA